MTTTITIDPVTRIEGHLQIEVTVDLVGGEQRVVDAHSTGTMFRGFETMMLGRDPRDASQYSQRICGVCPVSHALASCMNLEDAFGVAPPDNGRILRNLVLGANFIQSHLLHFYHLSAVDYIDTTGLLDGAPWEPRYVTPDMATGSVAADLVNHYLAALEMRRKAHQMGALFAGKLPCIGSFVVGGCTEKVTARKVADFRTLLDELRAFIDGVYLPDASTLAALFPSYFGVGGGSGNLLAYGVFDLDGAGSSRLFDGGRVTDGIAGTVEPDDITEHLKWSYYNGPSDVPPALGTTEPDPDKPDAYTWLKAPRYADAAHETGPLARMTINGNYDNGVSALDRIVARAEETKIIADAMNGWLDELVVGAPSYVPSDIPEASVGAGMTEAPRGALGHWMEIAGSAISRYQVVTPTTWNASPRDDLDQPGPIESALVDTPVDDFDQPIEVLRVVHSFDPCLACAVHMVRPGEGRHRKPVVVRPGIG